MFDFCDLWIDWQISQRRLLFEKQRRMVMSRLNKGEWGAELSVFNETPFMNRVVLFFNRLKLCESQYICSLICRRNMDEKKKIKNCIHCHAVSLCSGKLHFNFSNLGIIKFVTIVWF